jgi:retinol dehydrogenase 12
MGSEEPAPELDLRGQAVLVTGATSGLGYATAAALGRRGATVLVHGRTQEKAERAVRRLSDGAGPSAGKFVAVQAELSSLDEVRGLAAQVRASSPAGLMILINNAGAQHDSRKLSPEGIELTTAVVHSSPAALYRLLRDHLLRAADHFRAPAQVITVTSVNERFGKPVDDWSYETGYRQVRSYSNAKLMALSYTYALAGSVSEDEITFNAADPGFVFTDFGKKAGGFAAFSDRVLRPVAPLLIASPEKAARRSVLLAVAHGPRESSTGGFYAKGGKRTSSKRSRDRSVIDRIYTLTEDRLASLGI